MRWGDKAVSEQESTIRQGTLLLATPVNNPLHAEWLQPWVTGFL